MLFRLLEDFFFNNNINFLFNNNNNVVNLVFSVFVFFKLGRGRFLKRKLVIDLFKGKSLKYRLTDNEY